MPSPSLDSGSWRKGAARLLGLWGIDSAPATHSPREVNCWGDPGLEQMARRLRRDWAGVEAFLSDLSSIKERDSAIVGLAQSVRGRPRWLDDWIAQRSDDHLALLFRAAVTIAQAQRARGRTDAQKTSKRVMKAFHDGLTLAETDLDAAAKLAPKGDAAAWLLRLDVARGLEMDKSEALRIYAEAQRRNAWHPLAVSAMVETMSPRWGGSLPEMFDIARAAEAAPEGSSAHVSIIQAHVEASIRTAMKTYWRVPGVREDVVEAAQRSIGSPRYTQTWLALRDHNYFLYAFWRLGERQLWLRELEIVHGRLTAPFAVFANPRAIYRQMGTEMSLGTGLPWYQR